MNPTLRSYGDSHRCAPLDSAPSQAPWAFWCGGLLGALWPVVLWYVAWVFSSGGNIGAEGPKNWADQVLGYYMIASYLGCVLLPLLPVAVLLGFWIAGYGTAIIAVSVRRSLRCF